MSKKPQRLIDPANARVDIYQAALESSLRSIEGRLGTLENRAQAENKKAGRHG